MQQCVERIVVRRVLHAFGAQKMHAEIQPQTASEKRVPPLQAQIARSADTADRRIADQRVERVVRRGLRPGDPEDGQTNRSVVTQKPAPCFADAQDGPAVVRTPGLPVPAIDLQRRRAQKLGKIPLQAAHRAQAGGIVYKMYHEVLTFQNGPAANMGSFAAGPRWFLFQLYSAIAAFQRVRAAVLISMSSDRPIFSSEAR